MPKPRKNPKHKAEAGLHQFSAVTKRSSGALEIYDFTIPAIVLAEVGTVLRFEEDAQHGVQRSFVKSHAKGMAQSMRDGVPFTESITANLMGEWIYEDGELCCEGDSAVVEIIDGQHRLKAIEMLLEEEGGKEAVERYSFVINAVIGADDKTRRVLFTNQVLRRNVDTALGLVLRARDERFKSDVERYAYELAVFLNEHDDSPLKGHILFEEKARGRKQRNGDGVARFNVQSLMTHLKPVVGNNPRNPLRRLTQEERQQVVLEMFKAASAVYGHFLDPAHVLGQPLGICSMLRLLSSDGEFHLQVARRAGEDGNGYIFEAMREIFSLCARFQWKPRKDAKYRGAVANPPAVADRFNAFLRNKLG